MRSLNIFLLLLLATASAGCAFGPEFYPEPPDNSALPLVKDVVLVRTSFDMDAEGIVIQEFPLQKFAAFNEPRNMDLELTILRGLYDQLDEVNFNRGMAPVDGSGLIVARHIQYSRWGRETTETQGTVGTAHGEQRHGVDYREWSHISADQAAWRVRVRVRFESVYPDWKFYGSTVFLRFKDGKELEFHLFERP